MVPGGCTWSGGVTGPGVYLVLGDVPVLGGYLVLGGVTAPGGYLPRYSSPPPVNRITDSCENITLPPLRCGR